MSYFLTVEELSAFQKQSGTPLQDDMLAYLEVSDISWHDEELLASLEVSVIARQVYELLASTEVSGISSQEKELLFLWKFQVFLDIMRNF